MGPERRLREELVRFGRLCYERDLLVAMDGNLSARLPGGDVLCTRAGCHKGFLLDDDLLVVDREGRKKRGGGDPTSELALHLACYDERPDCMAVLHAHPPTAIAFTIAGVSMARCVLPEVVLTLGTIPTVPYATTGTQALADMIRPHVRERDAILMDTHGAVALGASLLDAFCKLETVEHTAKITLAARALGGARELPAAEAVHLRSMGLHRYGGPPAAVARAAQPGADLPEACLGCSGCNNPSPSGIAPRAGVSLVRVAAKPLQAAPAVERAIADEVLRALGR
jgi:L-fuculose-phosphate aldolase